jgi:hypothetical protein
MMLRFRRRFLSRFRPRWPMPKYDPEIEPHILFIITPPYSGSTALAQLLNSSNRTMLLQKRGEGQWLIPGLCESDRWSPDKKVNYESVKAVWLHNYQRAIRSDKAIDVVIEKSPPNMMRIEELSAQFRSCSFMANNRNPYANCASILYRRHDAQHIGVENRVRVLENSVDLWIQRSHRIKALIQNLRIPLVTYEVFCKDPNTVIGALQTPRGVAESIDPDACIKVKDYKVQKIVNHNERQISLLSDREIGALSAILVGHKQMMSYYDYQVL